MEMQVEAEVVTMMEMEMKKGQLRAGGEQGL